MANINDRLNATVRGGLEIMIQELITMKKFELKKTGFESFENFLATMVDGATTASTASSASSASSRRHRRWCESLVSPLMGTSSSHCPIIGDNKLIDQ